MCVQSFVVQLIQEWISQSEFNEMLDQNVCDVEQFKNIFDVFQQLTHEKHSFFPLITGRLSRATTRANTNMSNATVMTNRSTTSTAQPWK